MIRINLLPYREERRKAARKHFAVLAGMTIALGAAIVLMIHGFYANQISAQTDRNEFLKKEIAKLDKEIDEIKKLKDEIQALLSRKQVIETLQGDRAQTVYLLDQLVRQMPEGVYISRMTQRGLRVNLVGFAQSNARVSTLMRNIEASQWLEAPKLNEIKASTVDRKRVSEFNLDLSLRRVQAVESKSSGQGQAADPAAKKG